MESVFEFGDHRCVKCGQENGPSYFFKDRKTMEYVPDTNLLDVICPRCGHVWQMHPKDYDVEAEKKEGPKREYEFSSDFTSSMRLLPNGLGGVRFLRGADGPLFYNVQDREQWEEIKAAGDALCALDA